MEFIPPSGSELEYDATSILLRVTNSSLSASLCDPDTCVVRISDVCVPPSQITNTASVVNGGSDGDSDGDSDEESSSSVSTLKIDLSTLLPPAPAHLELTIDAGAFCLGTTAWPQSSTTYTAHLPLPPSSDVISGNTTDVPLSLPIYGIGVYVTDLSKLSLKDSTYYADLRVYIFKYYKSYTEQVRGERDEEEALAIYNYNAHL